nr:immunoglobulin heavy chain junction region [Mus musculus]MBK4186477.1 immunoglobulin heavy chain junction region [Mus musculus]
CARGYSQFGYW